MAGTGQFRRDTLSNWASVNPRLAEGELGLELGTNKMKFGNGINYWNDLPYANIGNTGPAGEDGVTQDISGKANIDDPTFTTKITTPEIVLPTNGKILLTVPATNGHATGATTNEFQSGYTSAIGDLVYLDTNSKWQKADKGTSVATYGGFLGIALEVKNANNALLVALPGSFVYTTVFPTLTIGSPVYMGDAGAITMTKPTAADEIRIIGYAVHADKIFFNPSSSLPDVGSYEPFIADYYVATTGLDSNPGTFSQPFKSWNKAFTTVTSGQLVYIRGGNYSSTDGWYSTLRAVRVSNKHGASGTPIRIEAYPGEVPILDGTSLAVGTKFGILMDTCNYWNFKGLHVINVKDTVSDYAMPWEMQSCTYMNFEGCVIHDSANGFSIQGSSDYLTFSNCDAYTNCDQHDDAGYANGFSANITSGHLAFINCRAWDNSDDGFDMFGSDGFITFDGCWAFNNGWGIYGHNGNGCGMKMGEATGDQSNATQRWVRNCLIFGNRTIGLDESDNATYPMITEAYNNTIFDNDEVGINYQDDNSASILSNNLVYANGTAYYPFGDLMTLANNSWQVATVTSADFVSIDPTGTDGARASNFSLPVLNFMKLASGSDCIDAGTDVGLPYLGVAPDLGCFERE
jgi:hypothetical protein